MKTKKGYFALACLLLGCSNGKLDRKIAAKEIQSHFKDNQSTIVVEVGRVSSHCAYVNKRDGKEVTQDLNPETALNAVVAIKAGYVSATPDGADFWKVSLTDKGQRVQDPSWQVSGAYHNQLKGCDYRFSSFPIAHPELVKITGISGDETSPDVDFEWGWTATELGAALREHGAVYAQLTPQQREALSSVIQGDPSPAVFKVPLPVPPEGQTEKESVKFKKYDDGWRSK
jgi:hypothetical protein